MTEGTPQDSGSEIRLINRGDDFGSFHAANMAIERAFTEGVLTSASLMVPPPWFAEAADICRRHPEFQVGVHTTLTSEWQFYRWGPVLPITEVPSLVDKDGCFYAKTQDFVDANPKLSEVEAELRAQVERALEYGVDMAYIDYHMRTARATPEIEEILFAIAAEYRVPVSRLLGDQDTPRLGDVADGDKPSAVAQMLRKLEPGFWMSVTHPGLDVPEMQAIRLGSDADRGSIAASRAADTEALTSSEVAAVIQERGIELVGYRDLRDQMRAAGEL
jgi:predicted glycoside hydrolase/deacetylase ChbG (UPF0249 family)